MTKEDLKNYLIIEAGYTEARVNDMDAKELFDKISSMEWYLWLY